MVAIDQENEEGQNGRRLANERHIVWWLKWVSSYCIVNN